MVYRVTRIKTAKDKKDRQGYYFSGSCESQVITEFYAKYPEYEGEEIEIEEWY